jgi:anaerobic magnesium-protoporphyrin IX monomethyl ester cyclase
MTDILLTHGYFLYEDEKERQIMKPYPPLGLLYLSAYLKRAGFSVSLYDSTLGSREELFARLAAEPGGVLGIYTNLITRANVIEIIRQAVQHRWTVVLGGPEAANYPDEYLNRGAHAIVAGEGEETLSELLPRLATDGPHRLDVIAGLYFRNEDGKLVQTPERDKIAAIDGLPWPDRAAVDIPEYMRIWKTHHGMSSVNLITARGCPYKCKWCSHAVFGYSHRRRSVLDCANELQEIYETYRPDQVWYADDVFTINHAWLHEYNAELKRRNLHLPFETISRADRMMKDEVLVALKELGCYRIWIGSESGSQKILDSMQRGVTAEQVQWATHAAQRHGIEVGMFLMWGYEGETLEDIEATIDHVKRANPNIFFTTVAYPIKNTPFFHAVSDRVTLSLDWERATDRDWRIQGRHSRNYYRHADRWLRNEVEAHRKRDIDPTAATELYAIAAQARQQLLAAASEVEA